MPIIPTVYHESLRWKARPHDAIYIQEDPVRCCHCGMEVTHATIGAVDLLPPLDGWRGRKQEYLLCLGCTARERGVMDAVPVRSFARCFLSDAHPGLNEEDPCAS